MRRIELIVHFVISVLPSTHFYLGKVKHLRVKCQGHKIENNVSRLRGEKHYISLEILQQAGLETARQATTLAKLHALITVPCPSLTVI